MPRVDASGTGCWVWGILLTCCSSVILLGSPVVPGVERLATEGQAAPEILGEVLIGELACVRCHHTESSRYRNAPAPDLSQVGARVSPQYLSRYLSDPHGVKPGTLMPDLLGLLPPGSKSQAVEDLTHFLVSMGGPLPASRSGGSPGELARGKELYESIGCVACHGSNEEELGPGFTPLGDLAAKTTIDALSQFLLNPHDIRAAGRMPSLWLEPEEARAVSVYLLRKQLESPRSRAAAPVSIAGLHVEYFEFDSVSQLTDFNSAEPVQKGTADNVSFNLPFNRRPNQFGLRFQGEITIAEDGEYEFATNSDDGSRMYLADELVVDNGGTHGMRVVRGKHALKAGVHSFELFYFNAGGPSGLNIAWDAGRGDGRLEPIPNHMFSRSGGLPMFPIGQEDFAVNATRAAAGKTRFRELGCASCHQLPGVSSARNAPALDQLNPNSGEGCLSGEARPDYPDYRLGEEQMLWIASSLENLTEPAAADSVRQTMASFNCYACHRRENIGGPTVDLAARFFASHGEIDLGEEGKIPPALDQVGFKLKPSALESILATRELHVRDYMKTRMPQFGKAELADFVRQVGEADDFTGGGDVPFEESDVAVGRQLVGINKGFACITCHGIAGQKALAIPGIDIAMSFDRLNPDWFKAFLYNPAKFIPGTRMPRFWASDRSLFTDIQGGDSHRQIESIWTYLSLKQSLPLPEGIVLSGGARMELVPVQAPIVHRTFMQDVGPRAILVGFPERLNVAFDANVVRLAKVWRGRFFDHSGVESGRTDRFLGPLSEDVIDLPPGPAIAQLATPQSTWPAVVKISRNIGGKFEGYRLDRQKRPDFRYRLGGVRIIEKPEPALLPGGAVLKRSLRLEGEPDGNYYFLAAQGAEIAEHPEGGYRVDSKVRMTLGGVPAPEPFLRRSNGELQLLVPVRFANGTASLVQRIEW